MGTEHILNTLEVRKSTRYVEVSPDSLKFERVEKLNARLLSLIQKQGCVDPGQNLVLDISARKLRVLDEDTGQKIDIRQTETICGVCRQILGVFAKDQADSDEEETASDDGMPQSPPEPVEAAPQTPRRATHSGEKLNYDPNAGAVGLTSPDPFNDGWTKLMLTNQHNRKAQREGYEDKTLRKKVGAAEVLDDEKALAPPPAQPAASDATLKEQEEQEQVMNEQGAMIQELDKQLDAIRKKEARTQKALEQAMQANAKLHTALAQEQANRTKVLELRKENAMLRTEIEKRDQQYGSVLQLLGSSEGSLKQNADKSVSSAE